MSGFRTLDAVVALLASERVRQIEVEGWSTDHDDAHAAGELFRAAGCYFLRHHGGSASAENGFPPAWPWDAEWWKPRDWDRDLVRAGALCLAERDRLDRLNAPDPEFTAVNELLGRIVRALLGAA